MSGDRAGVRNSGEFEDNLRCGRFVMLYDEVVVHQGARAPAGMTATPSGRT